MSFTVPRARRAHARARRSSRSSPTVGHRRASREDPTMGKVSVVGAGMKSHPGVAAKVFTTLGERGDQHRDDLDVADQDLLRRRRATRSRRRSRRCTRRSSWARTTSRPSIRSRTEERDELSGRSRGRHRRRRHRDAGQAARARLPGARAGPVRVGALRRARARGRRRRAAAVGRRRSRASTSRSSAPAPPRRASGRRASSTPAASSSTTRRASAATTTIPLVVSEVNPHALDRHNGLIANPNCSTMQLMVGAASRSSTRRGSSA